MSRQKPKTQDDEDYWYAPILGVGSYSVNGDVGDLVAKESIGFVRPKQRRIIEIPPTKLVKQKRFNKKRGG